MYSRLCWRLGYSSPRAGLCASLFCTSGDSCCHISLAWPWFLWMSAQTSGLPTNPPIFVSLANILKRHSAPSSKSLMKLLNHIDIPKVSELVIDLQLDMYSWTQFFEHGSSASFQHSSLSIYPVSLWRYYGRNICSAKSITKVKIKNQLSHLVTEMYQANQAWFLLHKFHAHYS